MQSGSEQIVYPTIETLAAVGGVSAAMVIAALSNPQAWDVVAGGPLGKVDLRVRSLGAKAELHSQLGEIHSGLMNKVKEGDLGAVVLAMQIATQRALLR